MKHQSKKLSVVVAVHNEARNLPDFFAAITSVADEIIVIDGQSDDSTVQICRENGAKVFVVPNQANFHINKQISIEKATCEWVLLMDADEIITPALAKEIREVVAGDHQEIDLSQYAKYRIHMHNIEMRDSVSYSQEKPIHGYFIARKNYFLGSYLMHSGVYPDGVIRLFANGYGRLPAKHVHEQVVIDGGVSWLREPMIHMSDPTFSRYIARANRYTELTALELGKQKKNGTVAPFFKYVIWKPISTFLSLFFRHRGYMDGFAGFIWSLMSSLHYPIAYMKFLEKKRQI